MNVENRDRLLDELLEVSLAQYSRVEAREGLEQRLIAGMRGRPRRASWWVLWRPYLVPASAALALAALTGVLVFFPRQPGPGEPPSPVSSVPAKGAPGLPPPSPGMENRIATAVPSDATPRRERPASPPRAAAQLEAPRPRGDRFPTPAVPTPEERALLQLVRQPQEVLEPVFERLAAEDRVPGEIAIERIPAPPISVEPIPIPVLGPR